MNRNEENICAYSKGSLGLVAVLAQDGDLQLRQCSESRNSSRNYNWTTMWGNNNSDGKFSVFNVSKSFNCVACSCAVLSSEILEHRDDNWTMCQVQEGGRLC